MLPVATTKRGTYIAQNGIEKTHIYLCAFCGAANHVPLEILENYN